MRTWDLVALVVLSVKSENCSHDRSRGEETARIMKSAMSSSDDRLERATTALDEAAGSNEDKEALEQNPSKCNSVTLILNSK